MIKRSFIKEYNFKPKLRDVEVDGKGLLLSIDSSNKSSAKLFSFLSEENKVSNLLNLLEEKDRNLYEVIRDGYKIKPFIDFDCKDVDKYDFSDCINFILELENQIENVIRLTNSKLTESVQFGVYTSSTKDKLSFHIIVLNYYVISTLECKQLILKSIDRLKYQPLSKYIDMKIYNNNRSFRLLGCTKTSRLAFKKSYEDEEINQHKVYEDSLITQVNEDSIKIHIEVDTKVKSISKSISINDEKINVILSNLNIVRFVDYNEWIKLLFILKAQPL